MDLRETLRGRIPFVGMTGRHLTELRAECDLGGVVERLVAKEHDLPLVQRTLDGSDFRLGQRR